MENTLHCVQCWWTTPDMRATKCKRCKEPLYLPDGRAAQQVVETAMQHGVSYYQAGYDPLYAPGVVAAQPILGHRPQSELTWVTLVRTFTVLTAMQQFAGAMISLFIVQGAVHDAFGVSIPSGFLLGVVIGTHFVLGVLATLFVLLSKLAPFRLLYCVGIVLAFVKYASVPIFPLGVFNLVFTGIFAFVLIMSLIAPSPNLPGGLKLDGATAFLAAVICAISLAACSGLTVQAYHHYLKQLNQSSIISAG